MPRKPLELRPGTARRFVDDMRAYFAETNLIKRDGIAARQVHALRQHYDGKLRLTDVKEMANQEDIGLLREIIAQGGSRYTSGNVDRRKYQRLVDRLADCDLAERK